MSDHGDATSDRIQRFRAAALPCLDDAYRLAYFLLQDRADAESAVQQCFRLALHRFDTRRGPATKPWLLAILRSVCHSDLARHGQHEAVASLTRGVEEEARIPQLLGTLPPHLREILVLRECNRMSYREIAEVTGVSMGIVTSRLSQARALLSARWRTGDDAIQGQSVPIQPRECDGS